MLRTVGDQPSLWESILPEACLGMPAELAAVDRFLDDPRFEAPRVQWRLGSPGSGCCSALI